MDINSYTKLDLLSAKLSVEIFPAEQVKSIAADLSSDLTGYVSTQMSNVHTHSNKAVLDGITAENVTAWGEAEQNAKDYADEQVAALSDVYDTKGAAATAVAAVVNGAPEAFDTLKEISDWISDDQSGVSSLVSRIASLETNKADLTAVYTQGQADAKFQLTGDYATNTDLAAKADLSAVYTKTDVDTALTGKADATDMTAVKDALSTAAGLAKLATDGSISTRDIIAKVNALIDALAVSAS